MRTAEVVVDGEVVGYILIGPCAWEYAAPWIKGETLTEFVYDTPENALAFGAEEVA